MNPFSAFVVYMLIWWLTLFMILPQGVQGQAEADDIVEGSEPGAPVDANIKGKFIKTTKIATIAWLIICAFIMSGLVSLEDVSNWFNR